MTVKGWRVAGSLLVLRSEIDALAPARDRSSDGTIGDPAHSARLSEHNPNAAGIVCAHDFTHDPAAGADMHQISAGLLARRHPAIWYVIFDRRLASAKTGWTWVPYQGASEHLHHLHVSVHGPVDDFRPWGLLAAAHEAKASAERAAREADDMDQEAFTALLTAALDDPAVVAKLARAPWVQEVGRSGKTTHAVLFGEMRTLLAAAAAHPDVDTAEFARDVAAELYRLDAGSRPPAPPPPPPPRPRT